MSISPCRCKSLRREDIDPDCPWHGLAPCRNCGENVWGGGGTHYITSVGHLTDPSDAITPYYTCEREKKRTDDYKPRVHGAEDTSGALGDAVRKVREDEGTENDWRNRITVPRPTMWGDRPELKGQSVVPHMCLASEHGNSACVCDILGKPVVIVGVHTNGDPWHSTRYDFRLKGRIKKDKRSLQEQQFSDETRGLDWDDALGYVLENADGKFLSPAFVWMPAPEPLAGYLHSKDVVKSLLNNHDFPNGKPVRAYPAVCKLDGKQKRITDDPVSWDELKL